jgi:DNA-binding transcriptional LysR family regulator
MIDGSTPAPRTAWQLDWNLLRTFMVIVQEKGVTAAADRLLLKQPTVSNALKRLETTLGRRLIDRGPGHFRVTEAGELLYQECVEIFGSVARLSVLMREVTDEVTGHVTIAVASHVVCPLFDEVLAEFHSRHPKATMSIEVATSVVVIDHVLRKQATLGICLVHRQLPQLEYRRLFREHFGFFCGPRHRLFGRAGLALSDLKGETSVSFKTDRLSDALRPVALIRAAAQLEDRVVGLSSHLEEVRRMIVAGLGIGPLPIHVVERDIADGLLWRLPPYDDPPAIDIYVVHNPRAHLNRAERSLRDALLEAIDTTPIAARTYPSS